jgi:hypothetical protein
MAPAKNSAGKSSANKAKAAKPNASVAKASAAKASAAKASTAKAGAVVKTATQSRTATRADIDDGERETDVAEDNDMDDEGGDGDDMPAEPETKSKSGGAVSKGSRRPATRPTNANQHPGEQQKALDRKRRSKAEMIEVRKQEAEQKRRKEEVERQKQAAQDKAVDRVAQFEMELADDAFNDTPLPRNRRALQFDLAVVDQRESDQDDDGVDDGANDGARGSDVTDEIEKATPARASKRKGRVARADVEEDVIQETSASEGEDRPKKKAKGKAAETYIPSESEVEIVEVPKPRGKIPKKTIRDAITDQKNIDQNLHIDKARSSDAPAKLKPQR